MSTVEDRQTDIVLQAARWPAFFDVGRLLLQSGKTQ